MALTNPRPKLYTAGTEALDLVLGGGIQQGAVMIFAGLPGAGKTVLAQQAVFANATPDHRALYLATYSEPLAKVVRHLQKFSFYDEEKMHSSVVYRDLGQQLRAGGVATLADVLEEYLQHEDYSLVVIDSLKALHDLNIPIQAFRLALFDAAARFAVMGVTSIWLGEYAPEAMHEYPEFAVADGILELRNTSHGLRTERSLRVLKMRGAAPLPGEHTFTIGTGGLEVFPRLIAADDLRRRAPRIERMTSEVDGLDQIMGGGFWRGTSTLVLGPAGSGKTTLGLSYLAAGARLGEHGLLLTLEESPQELMATMTAFAPDQAHTLDRVTIMHESPIEADLVQVILRVREEIELGKVKRLVVDAIGGLRDAAIDPRRLRAVIHSFIHFCAAKGVTVLLNGELTLTGEQRLEDIGIPTMVDNIILLRHATTSAQPTLTVLKARRSAHGRDARPIRIDAGGFHVAPEPTEPAEAPPSAAGSALL